MSSPGLSLVGFMTDQQQAFQHLRMDCVPADASDGAILAEWAAAKVKRGPPMPKAGAPDIQPMPTAAAPYITQLMQEQWVKATFQIFGVAKAELKWSRLIRCWLMTFFLMKIGRNIIVGS